MCRELSPDQVEGLYVSESFLKESEHKEVLEGFSWELVSDQVMGVMADTKTLRGFWRWYARSIIVLKRSWMQEKIL